MTTATNGPSIRDVDAAVRSVVARLASPPAVGSGNGRSRSDRDADVFAGRLLSLREAEALPGGTRVVRVAPGTVVTPLAKDFLKGLGVEVRVVSRSEGDRGRNAGEWGLAIESESGLVDAFRRALLDGGEPWHGLGPVLDDAARWVAETGSRGALFVTDDAPRAVYWGCQVAEVRAASAVDPASASRAVRSIGVNLLVVEPAGKSISLLKQIGAAFRRAGAPVAPDWAVATTGGHVR
jgi:hypothetical protein